MPKELTVKDFFDAFLACEVKCPESLATIRNLMTGCAMDIAAGVAYELHKQNIKERVSSTISLEERLEFAHRHGE